MLHFCSITDLQLLLQCEVASNPSLILRGYSNAKTLRSVTPSYRCSMPHLQQFCCYFTVGPPPLPTCPSWDLLLSAIFLPLLPPILLLRYLKLSSWSMLHCRSTTFLLLLDLCTRVSRMFSRCTNLSPSMFYYCVTAASSLFRLCLAIASLLLNQFSNIVLPLHLRCFIDIPSLLSPCSATDRTEKFFSKGQYQEKRMLSLRYNAKDIYYESEIIAQWLWLSGQYREIEILLLVYYMKLDITWLCYYGRDSSKPTTV